MSFATNTDFVAITVIAAAKRQKLIDSEIKKGKERKQEKIN